MPRFRKATRNQRSQDLQLIMGKIRVVADDYDTNELRAIKEAFHFPFVVVGILKEIEEDWCGVLEARQKVDFRTVRPGENRLTGSEVTYERDEFSVTSYIAL